MNTNWKRDHVQLNIDKLDLDLKNPRTDTGQENITKDSVIRELLTENVLELVRDIADNGYLAVSTLMVIREKNKNVVIDGNRRLLAAKILQNPNIIRKYISGNRLNSIRKISQGKLEDVSILNAIIYPKRKDAEHEMAILHLTGLAIPMEALTAI